MVLAVRTRGRVAVVVTGASLLLNACALGGDRLKTAGADSAATATPASVRPQQVAPGHTAILTPVTLTATSTTTTLDLANAAASPASNSGATSLPGASSASGVAAPPTQPPTTPSPTTPPPTTPPATAPSTSQVPLTTPATLPPEITPLTEDEAIFAWETYLGEAAARDYSTAWNNLSQQYQIKYLGYDNFKRFWETVQGAGVRSYTVVSSVPNGLTLELHVWYGRRKDSTVSNEVVNVDVIKDMATGTILIDDYRYLGHG